MADCITTAGFMAFFCPDFSAYGCPSTGSIAFDGPGLAGDTLTIGTLTATAIAGARAAGSSTWTIGATAADSAANFAVMLSDSLFSEVVDRTVVSTLVTLSTVAVGYSSLLDVSVTGTASDYTITEFSGGALMVDTVIASVCGIVGACFGGQRHLAQYYLTAHMLAGLKGLDVGVQTSAAINAISAGFTSTPFGLSDAVYSGTSYGRQFLLVRSIVPRFGFSVIANNGVYCGC